MTITHIKGDITDVRAGYILHQVNCQFRMGAGVAKALYSKYPQVKSKYIELGETVTPAGAFGRAQAVKVDPHITVVNMFSQFDYAKGPHDKTVYTSYSALALCLQFINENIENKNIPIYIPYKFGCGLANGDWNVVYPLFCHYLKDFELVVFVEKES